MTRKLLLFAIMLAPLCKVSAQSVVKNRAYYEDLGSAVTWAQAYQEISGGGNNGEDPLYGGGHGMVIRASVAPTWTSASLAGSGAGTNGTNTSEFSVDTPYGYIFKDDKCNSTGYFPHSAPAHVYLGGFVPRDAGGNAEDVYFTVLRCGSGNGTDDADYAGRGSSFPSDTSNPVDGDAIGGYVVVGKGLTPTQLVALRTKIASENSGDAVDYEDYESSYRTGMYGLPTFCSETALDNVASYPDASSMVDDEVTITIPSFIMLDDQYDNSGNELITYIQDGQTKSAYTGRHIILKVVGIDFGAFSDAEHAHFILPPTITYIGDSGLRKTGGGTDGVPYRKISFHSGSNVYPFIGSEIYDVDNENWADCNHIESFGHYAMSYAEYRDIRDVVDVNALKEYGDHCFQGWTSLTNLNLANTPNVTRVGRGAFAHCPNLTSVQIGENIEEIGEQAFYYCPELESLSFVAPSGDPTGATMQLTSIGNHAFEGCHKLETFVPPVSLTTVGDYAFYGCNLGAGGRFDLPRHIKHLGEYALANNGISYIPFIAGTDENPTNPVSDNGLFLGYRSFYEPGTDVTVELNAKIPPRIISDGRPFDTDDDHRVRIIVPLGSGECYVHGIYKDETLLPFAGLFSREYHHHEFRGKFDLTKAYSLPQYGHDTGKDGEGNFTYVTAPWRVASSAWELDTYILKPSHGGTVDTYTSSSTTNNAGESKTLWTPAVDYYIDPDDGTTEHGTQHVFGRTAHQYYDNESLDDIPKVSTLEVTDGILPPDEGLLIAYTVPHTYLVPLYADYGQIQTVVKTVPQKYGIEVETTTVNDATTDLTRFRIEQKMAQFDTDELLTLMRGQYWYDFNNHTAKWRQIAVWNDAGTDYEIKWVDLLNNKDLEGNSFVVDFSKTVTVNKTFTRKWMGTSYDNTKTTKMEKVTVKKYDYWTNSSGRPYRCAAGFNKFIIPSGINWAEASEAGAAHLKSLLTPVSTDWFPANYEGIKDPNKIVDVTVGDKTYKMHRELYYLFVPCTYVNPITGVKCGNTGNGGVYGQAVLNDWHCRQWIDIFELVQEYGTSEGEIRARHDFHDNHTDHGNVLVPCIEPTYVWPFWLTVDEETYLSAKAADANSVTIARKYSQDSEGAWSHTDHYVLGSSDVEMNGDDYADGFMSFGLSNGYFVQTRTAGNTKANRAYFCVHTSALHPTLYKPESSSGSTTRMVIVDEEEIQNGLATGLNSVGRNPGAAPVWYTIDGRRLGAAPTQRGVYIRDGRKVVIK